MVTAAEIKDSTYSWEYESYNWKMDNGGNIARDPETGRYVKENISFDPETSGGMTVLDSFYDFNEALEYAGDRGVAVGALGKAYRVADHGGEGQGDGYFYVFKLVTKADGLMQHLDTEQYFKVDGYYASYDGGYYDELFEVFPKQVTVTQWGKQE